MFSCEYSEIFENSFLFLDHLRCGYFFQFDRIAVPYWVSGDPIFKNKIWHGSTKKICRSSQIINRNHSNTFLLNSKNLSKVKHCSKGYFQGLVLISRHWQFRQVFGHYLMPILMTCKYTGGYIYQEVSEESSFATTCSEKE